MESFETKMKPIIIKEGPSKKVFCFLVIHDDIEMFMCVFIYKFEKLFQANWKIAAAKLHYEIYALTQRLRLTTIRVEYEEAVSNTNINKHPARQYYI